VVGALDPFPPAFIVSKLAYPEDVFPAVPEQTIE
jgi:hypothetical protein